MYAKSKSDGALSPSAALPSVNSTSKASYRDRLFKLYVKSLQHSVLKPNRISNLRTAKIAIRYQDILIEDRRDIVKKERQLKKRRAIHY